MDALEILFLNLMVSKWTNFILEKKQLFEFQCLSLALEAPQVCFTHIMNTGQGLSFVCPPGSEVQPSFQNQEFSTSWEK